MPPGKRAGSHTPSWADSEKSSRGRDSVILRLLGDIPGIIHALWLVLTDKTP